MKEKIKQLLRIDGKIKFCSHCGSSLIEEDRRAFKKKEMCRYCITKIGAFLMYRDAWIRDDGAVMNNKVYRTFPDDDNHHIAIHEIWENGVITWQNESPRPYRPGQPCDGTIDACVHALFIHFCRSKNLDPVVIYKTAYSKEDIFYDVLMYTEKGNFEGVSYPEDWNKENFDLLLDSLREINNRSLADVLEDIIDF